MSSAFKLVSRTLWNHRIGVAKYQSAISGLSVCFADVEGPNVSGSIVIGTESPDEDGLPHTLEHLVFMGSEAYPFRVSFTQSSCFLRLCSILLSFFLCLQGLLDILANRCLADGNVGRCHLVL